MTVLRRILLDVVGNFSDCLIGIRLTNLLYHHEIGVKLPDGSVASLVHSMREAAQEVDALFVGQRPDGIQLTPDFKYAMWLWYYEDPPSADLQVHIDDLAGSLLKHSLVAYVRRSN